MDWTEREKVGADSCCPHTPSPTQKGAQNFKASAMEKMYSFFFLVIISFLFPGGRNHIYRSAVYLQSTARVTFRCLSIAVHWITCHGFYCSTESTAAHVIPGLFCGARTFSLKTSASSLWLEMLILFSRNCHGRSHSCYVFWRLFPPLHAQRAPPSSCLLSVAHECVCVWFGTKAGVVSLIHSCGEFQSEFF